MTEEQEALVSRLLTVFRPLAVGSDDSIQWGHVCKVLQCVDPTIFAQDSLDNYFRQVVPDGTASEPGEVIHLQKFLSLVCKPPLSGSVKAGSREEGGEHPQEQPTIRIRQPGGDVVHTLLKSELTDLTVGDLKVQLSPNLNRSKDEMRLLAGEQVLGSEELLANVLGDSNLLELLMLVHKAPALDPDINPLEQLPTLKEMIMCWSEAVQLSAVRELRKLLSIELNPPIERVIQVGVVPRLVELCKTSQNPEIQCEAAWALTNVASGSSQQTQCAVESGAGAAFVQLLSSPDDSVKEQAVWGLGNIAGDAPNYRDLVNSLGALAPLLAILQDEQTKVAMRRTATWALSNLFRGKPAPQWEIMKDALPVLVQLLSAADEEILSDACWTLSYILDDGPELQIQAVIDSGACTRLVELLGNAYPGVQTAALRVTGNIVTGSNQHTQALLECNVLAAYSVLLSHPKRAIRRDTCWSLSNILAESEQQIQAVIDQQLVPPLVAMLNREDHDQAVQKEVVWALCNLCDGGSDKQVKYVVDECGIVDALMGLLADVTPSNASGLILTTLQKLLEHGDRRRVADQLERNPVADLATRSPHLSHLDGLLAKSYEGSKEMAEAVAAISAFLSPQRSSAPAV